jgi:hypothetical protein
MVSRVMKGHATGGVAGALWVCSLVLAAVAVWLDAVGPSPLPAAEEFLLAVEVLAFTTAGALVASRRPGSPIGWLLLAEGLVWEVVAALDAYVRHVPAANPAGLPAGPLAAWVLNWVWIPAFGIVVLLFLLFPDGRLPGRRWRVVLGLAALGSVLNVAARVLMPGPLAEAPAIVNPLGVRGSIGLWRVVEGVGNPLLGLMVIAAIVSLVVRFRRAGGVERQQLKWLALAGVVAVVVGVLVDVVELTGLVGHADTGNLLLASFAGIPIATAIAVLRYRLYDIDRLLNRTLVYAVLTALLGTLYAGAVLGLGQLFGGLGAEPPSWAVAGATLAVAALFQPARRRIQAVVDRRFNRRRYDAARTVEAFSARLRDQIDLDSITSELLAVADQTMEPTGASLWLRPPATAPQGQIRVVTNRPASERGWRSR